MKKRFEGWSPTSAYECSSKTLWTKTPASGNLQIELRGHSQRITQNTVVSGSILGTCHHSKFRRITNLTATSLSFLIARDCGKAGAAVAIDPEGIFSTSAINQLHLLPLPDRHPSSCCRPLNRRADGEFRAASSSGSTYWYTGLSWIGKTSNGDGIFISRRP